MHYLRDASSKGHKSRGYKIADGSSRDTLFRDNILSSFKDLEFGNNNGNNDLQELMDVLPNIDLSDVMEIPKVFQCDEQTLPCDHTTKYRTITGRAAKKIKSFFLS